MFPFLWARLAEWFAGAAWGDASVPDEFRRQQAREFRALRGRTVTRWGGVEMALVERGKDGCPVWEHASFPALQLLCMQVELEHRELMSVTTVMNDDLWGLCLRPKGPTADAAETWAGIYRVAGLVRLPLGVVSGVEVSTDEHLNIARVALTIGNHEVVVRAGEVYEAEETLRVVEMDESVLVQLDGSRP